MQHPETSSGSGNHGNTKRKTDESNICGDTCDSMKNTSGSVVNNGEKDVIVID